MGLFQTLIINYEITGVIFLEAVILVIFTPVVINVWFCAVSQEQTSLRLPKVRHKLLINNSIKGNTNYKAKRTTQKGNQKHKLR